MQKINKEIFPDEIDVRSLGEHEGSSFFRLLERYRINTSKGLIEVRKFFITDGASIPKLFWGLLHPYGKYFPAALGHDFLYSNESNYLNLTRKQADQIFLELCLALNVNFIIARTMYWAVRSCGWMSYKKEKPDVFPNL